MQFNHRHVTASSALIVATWAQLGCAPDSSATAPSPAALAQKVHPSHAPVMYPSTGVGFWDPTVPAKQSELRYSNEQAGDVSEDEKAKAIAVAKQYLAEKSASANGHEFQVSRHEDGYTVFVEFVYKHDEQGHPLHAVGGHCAIVISPDWEVTSAIGGL
jgi:hypothetical protein